MDQLLQTTVRVLLVLQVTTVHRLAKVPTLSILVMRDTTASVGLKLLLLQPYLRTPRLLQGHYHFLVAFVHLVIIVLLEVIRQLCVQLVLTTLNTGKVNAQHALRGTTVRKDQRQELRCRAQLASIVLLAQVLRVKNCARLARTANERTCLLNLSVKPVHLDSSAMLLDLRRLQVRVRQGITV